MALECPVNQALREKHGIALGAAAWEDIIYPEDFF